MPQTSLQTPRMPTVFGMALRRPVRELGIDPFYVELVAGMEGVLVPLDGVVLLQVVQTMEEEIATYERWAEHGDVAGVVVGDLVDGDTRTEVLRRLGLPWVLIGAADGDGGAAVAVDNVGPMRDAVLHLAALGHRSVARVSGPARLLHTAGRAAGFEAAVAAAGIVGTTVEGDYTADSGASCTRALLESEAPPTAVVYDNDVMAVAGLRLATELGVAVPGDLSLLAWDDSASCRLAAPPLSAVHRDVFALGEAVATALHEIVTGTRAAVVRAKAPTIITRGTTAGPAAALAAGLAAARAVDETTRRA